MASSHVVDSEIAKDHVDDGHLTDHGIASSSDESLDDNYAVFKGAEALEYDEAEGKRVLRKIDLRVMPVLFVTYFLQYLDKSEFAPSRSKKAFSLARRPQLTRPPQTPSTSPPPSASKTARTSSDKTTPGSAQSSTSAT